MSALGRVEQFDERSRAYALEAVIAPKTVMWERRSPILDQGQLGCCEGASAADWLATDTAARPGRSDITIDLAHKVYSKATHLDGYAGVWPSDDTGTSTLAALKALKALGLTTGPYRHAFSLTAALSGLQAGPLITGIAWKTGCDSPDSHGLIRWTGSVRGGHALLLDGYDHDRALVRLCNHWTAGWADHGHCWMPVEDYSAALKARGDVGQPS